jgi:hypothetical protein
VLLSAAATAPIEQLAHKDNLFRLSFITNPLSQGLNSLIGRRESPATLLAAADQQHGKTASRIAIRDQFRSSEAMPGSPYPLCRRVLTPVSILWILCMQVEIIY